MHIILVANNCSLSWGGECALAYRWFEGLRNRGICVSLVTHVRSRTQLRSHFGDDSDIYYIDDERYARRVWRLGNKLIPAARTQLSWATTGTFLRVAFELQARALISSKLVGRDTVIHRVSPIAPRWPCLFGGLGVPTIVGPLSALPQLPPGFGKYARSQRLGLYRRLKLAGAFVSRLLPAPQQILCANQYTVSCVPKHLQHRCSIMPENGILPGQFEPSFEVHDPPVILMVSRLSAEKFCDLGIRAFKIARSNTDARLVLIGDGPERQRLEQLVSDLDLTSAVSFLGHVDHADVGAHFRRADIYCHPSVLDASPTSVLEAMACGKPTVCADVGGHAAWVVPDAGLAVKSENPTQLVAGLAEAMLQLIRCPQRRIEMGFAAVAQIKAGFEWPAKIDATLPLYSSLLEGVFARQP